MVDKKKYEEALIITEEYEEQLNSTLITNRVCAICKIKEITRVDGCGYTNPIEQERCAWNDGTVEKISFGYGSIQHDMDAYYIAVCDGCITDLKEKGLATSIKEIRKKVREHKS